MEPAGTTSKKMETKSKLPKIGTDEYDLLLLEKYKLASDGIQALQDVAKLQMQNAANEEEINEVIEIYDELGKLLKGVNHTLFNLRNLCQIPEEETPSEQPQKPKRKNWLTRLFGR